MDSFYLRGRMGWPPRHVTEGWPRERPSRNIRYYTYTDDDEDGTDNRNDIPISKHYANMSMHYAEIFKGCKNDNFT